MVESALQDASISRSCGSSSFCDEATRSGGRLATRCLTSLRAALDQPPLDCQQNPICSHARLRRLPERAATGTIHTQAWNRLMMVARWDPRATDGMPMPYPPRNAHRDHAHRDHVSPTFQLERCPETPTRATCVVSLMAFPGLTMRMSLSISACRG